MFGRLMLLLLRAPAQVALWLLLLVVALGPQHSLLVCTSGACCTEVVAAAPAHACCCCEEAAPRGTADDPRGERNRARRCGDCCIDVALLTEPGPLPRAVDCPDGDPRCTGTIEHTPLGAPTGSSSRFDTQATGPPRPDQRTRLIAMTVLRR